MKLKTQLFCCLGMALLLSSCAPTSNKVVEIPEPLEDTKTAAAETRTPGSLWSKGNASIFSDHKARNIGDIVTIIISEQSSATKQAATSTDRSTTMTAGIPNYFGIENTRWIDSLPLDLSTLISANFDNDFEGAGSTSRSGTLSASLSTQVIDRYPNGNLKVRGGKEVMVNNEVQIIYLTGIVRPVDITAANTIASDKILNARISYTGEGAISDKQQPGWAMRTWDNLWPF